MKKPEQISKIFSTKRILSAVVIGMLVSMVLIFRDFDLSRYKEIHWGFHTVFYVFGALILMAVRDLAYMYRLRVLTENKIIWRHSFQVIILWEFASALTPSVVGGSAAAFYIVSKECNSVGKSTAIVMITALLDELFYIIMVPLLFLFISTDKLLIYAEFNFFNLGEFPTKFVFTAGYLFTLVLTTIISIAVFWKPMVFKKLLLYLFDLKILRRWKPKAEKTGDEIIITSTEMRGKSFGFWFKAFAATFFSWTARFLVVNFLILAFIKGGDQLIIYARQLVMWVILLMSPTPGGSGVAEYMLPKFIGEYMGDFGNEIALMWRLISYYVYLIIGSVVLPIWLRRIYMKPEK